MCVAMMSWVNDLPASSGWTVVRVFIVPVVEGGLLAQSDPVGGAWAANVAIEYSLQDATVWC
jgi:hypothetical protein